MLNAAPSPRCTNLKGQLPHRRDAPSSEIGTSGRRSATMGTTYGKITFIAIGWEIRSQQIAST